MKNLRFILYALALLVLAGCNNNYDYYSQQTYEANNKRHFARWKEFNEKWIEDYRTNELGSDTAVLRTEILPSGVMIESFHDGFGPIPKRNVDPVRGKSSDVYVSMEGFLADGTNFLLKGTTEYAVSDLTEGLMQAFSIMPQGSHWRVILPYETAYGENGSVGTTYTDNFSVPPYSVLIFDIDLLDVTNY